MLFLGDNTRFGGERVELTQERFVDVADWEDDRFPLGVAGLIPVCTSRRKKGGLKTVYAFPFEEGELVAPEAVDASSDLDPRGLLASELCEAVDFINLLLSEAAELSGYPFGKIAAIWGGINESGYSFTRVERAAENEYGDQGSAPIHLRVETSDRVGEPGTVSAVIEFDRLGYPLNVQIVEYGEGRLVRRITCAIDFDARDVLVQKVVEDAPGMAEPVVLYWRHPPRWFGAKE